MTSVITCGTGVDRRLDRLCARSKLLGSC